MVSLLQEYVAAQAERRGESVAIVARDERLTYGELEESSNRLARLLKEVGCRRGDRVCLFLPKTPAAIASMLGVLKADCMYVPIDLTSPAPRVAKIVSACEPRALLVAAPASRLLDELLALGALADTVQTVAVEESVCGENFRTELSRSDWARYPAEPLAWRNSTRDAAHILFTSGSTGTPKGVVITHANVIAFVEWARGYFGTAASDRISGHPPLYFDLSTFDIYGTQSVGAQLHLVHPELSLAAHKLAEFIRNSELTQWFSVPSILTYMAKFDAVRFGDFPSLKRLLWCGELMPTPTLIHWMKRLPHVAFTNLYGPTETTIASSYYTVPECPRSDTDPIPIGTACAGEELLVLDDELRPVPAGGIGSVYIGGVGLSPGYWLDEERTRCAFLQDHRASDPTCRLYRTGDLARVGSDGQTYFVGRADSQIKSRGYRIELGEIEAALDTLHGLKECAVVGVPTGGFEGTAICCAYSTLGDGRVEPAQLRRELTKVLPSYMLPSRWMEFDALPKNANGKTDRKRLKELFEEERST